ncbi:alpha/beta-hydrolase [Peniophora sp. CONT]|nr:alpha/beta-hydrolase [Peniophora sp. CONT]
MSCEHCVTGVRHEGTPEGSFTDIAGIKSYVATPAGDYDKSKVIIYITDVFGFELVNHLLLADDFARAGFKVFIPDICENDPLPHDFFDNPLYRAKLVEDLDAWLGRHSFERNLKRLQSVIHALKADGVQRFGSTSYCYGGRMIFDLVYAGDLDVATTSHPSFLALEDLDKYAAGYKTPLLINSCEVDERFGKEFQDRALEVFKNAAAPYNQPYFPGCVHGFAVRGDMSDPLVKAGKEGAFKSVVDWHKKYL